jgi:translation initiation factor IF-1
MSKENYVEFEGEVLQIYPAGKFQVELKLENDETRNIVAHISGKMRMNKINILAGDQVTVEVSPYDLTQGRITYRHK